MAQMVKNLPAMWETWVQSLDQEDPLEKEMAAHSSILAWRIPWTEEPGGLCYSIYSITVFHSIQNTLAAGGESRKDKSRERNQLLQPSKG